MTADHAPAPRRIVLPTFMTLIGLTVLIGLGMWQLERKAWKDAIVASLGEKLTALPGSLPPREAWPRTAPAESEFRRVTFPAEFLHDAEALVYSAGSALRTDVSGPGYWVFTPARLTGGSLVVINRGFVPEGRENATTRPQGQVSGVVEIAGYMRWPEQRGTFSATDNPARNVWFVRDHLAIAQSKGWGPVAPFYIDQEGPVPAGGVPKAGPLRAAIRNNHLQYALTWFGLAACLASVFAFWVRARLKSTSR